jgi:hypothetical protein
MQVPRSFKPVRYPRSIHNMHVAAYRPQAQCTVADVRNMAAQLLHLEDGRLQLLTVKHVLGRRDFARALGPLQSLFVGRYVSGTYTTANVCIF